MALAMGGQLLSNTMGLGFAYNVDPHDRVESFLLLPKNLRGKTPAILALQELPAVLRMVSKAIASEALR